MIKKTFKCYRCKKILFRDFAPNIISVMCSCGAENCVKAVLKTPKSLRKGAIRK